MLNAIKGRWEFPQLKEKALEQYRAWSPECLLIEKKAAGAPLIQELRQMDMIVEEYSPSRSSAGVSNDKRARVNAVSPLFFDKVVWAPEQRWAMDVINECAEFPNGENDDFVDCCIEGTQILMADGTTRAIEHVQEGDFVHTPKGARRVQISVCTGIHATIRLKTTQGHTIEATPNHPIATTRGWVRLTDVRTTDTTKCVKLRSQRSYEQLDFVARRASVETIALTNEKRKVFNLTVEDAQCFYANGILVHNCCSMALARYRRGGFVSLSSDRGDEPQFFKRKTSGYY
jgi:predicted phage terminase large subunit-like protein